MLSTVLETLGPSVLGVVGALPRRSLAVSESVLWDPMDPIPPIAGGILLMVGGAPTSPVVAAAIEDTGRLGYTAVVVKARSTSLESFVRPARRAGVALLVTPDDASWSTLDSLITSAITSQRDTGDGTLGEIAAGDLFALANVIASLAASPVTIEDVERHVLAYSNLADQPIDRSRRDSILGRHVPGLPNNLDEYRVVAAASSAVHFPPEDDEIRARVAVPVRVGQRLLGSIWAQVNDEDQVARISRTLTSVAPIASLHLMRAASTTDVHRQRRADLLAAALSMDTSTGSGAPWTVRERLPVVLLGFAPRPGADELLDEQRLTDVIAVNAETVRGDASCARVDAAVFVLLPDADGLTPGRVAGLARRSVRAAAASVGCALVCAYSDVVTDAQDIAGVRRDIETTLRALRRLAPEVEVAGIVADRHHLVVQELLESGMGSPQQLIGPVREILAHDAAHGTAYAPTLLAHLDCFGDAALAARRMVVHENSHRYRMRRLVQEFALDLDDPQLRLVIWLQLSLALRTGRPAQGEQRSPWGGR